MIDQHFDRQYQAGRSDLNAAIVAAARQLGKALGNAFAVLNRVAYAAPWVARPRRARAR
jgi:hypothetical protein